MICFRKILFPISLIIIILFSSVLSAATDKLIFAIDIIRHGDRTSIRDLPNVNHIWQEGLGQLTAVGMRQEYELGKKLHHRYIIEEGLLPDKYKPDTLYIHSTDYDRTIMSASSLLLGLYPLGTGPALADSTPALPSHFQPIPIHTIPAGIDSIFSIDMGSSKVSALLEKYVYSSAEWKEKSSQLQPNFKRWSQITGFPINNLQDLGKVGDTLTTYLAHNIGLPKGLSVEEAQLIIKQGQWVYTTVFKPTQIGETLGNRPLNKIINYIQQAAEKKSNTKFILVSAHDSTLLAIMSALHTPLNTPPPYASDLNFSLYQDNVGTYFITATYNDQPVHISGCSSKCTLEQFLMAQS